MRMVLHELISSSMQIECFNANLFWSEACKLLKSVNGRAD